MVEGALGMSVGAAGRWNASDTEPAVFESEVAPGADFERFLRGMYGLAADSKTDGRGIPRNPLQFALLLRAADLVFPGVPVPLQRAVCRALCALASLTGAHRDLDSYAV